VDIDYNGIVISIQNLPEEKLARYQQNQTGNSCAICSACSALNILYNVRISAGAWIKYVDSLTVPAIWPLRLYPNGPTTPAQQANLLRRIADREGLRGLEITRHSSSVEEIQSILLSPNQVVLVTIGWVFSAGPKIMPGKSIINLNSSTSRFGYHTMLLAAYSPEHIHEDGVIRPWGFINSWMDGGSQIFWIDDMEFRQHWSILTPLGGIRSAVILTRV
jgi:hypothetical protein